MAKFNKQSIELLKEKVAAKQAKSNQKGWSLAQLFEHYKANKNPNVKDEYVGFIYLLWNLLNSAEKGEVFEASGIMPAAGGYYNVNDNCIFTMLKSAFPINSLTETKPMTEQLSLNFAIDKMDTIRINALNAKASKELVNEAMTYVLSLNDEQSNSAYAALKTVLFELSKLRWNNKKNVESVMLNGIERCRDMSQSFEAEKHGYSWTGNELQKDGVTVAEYRKVGSVYTATAFCRDGGEMKDFSCSVQVSTAKRKVLKLALDVAVIEKVDTDFDQQLVIKALQDAPNNTLTMGDIALSTNIKQHALNVVIGELLDSDKIKSIGYNVFKLANDSTVTVADAFDEMMTHINDHIERVESYLERSQLLGKGGTKAVSQVAANTGLNDTQVRNAMIISMRLVNVGQDYVQIRPCPMAACEKAMKNKQEMPLAKVAIITNLSQSDVMMAVEVSTKLTNDKGMIRHV